MICPRCHSEFDNVEGACPACGVQLLRNISGVMKTSAVMIAARGENGFYRSVQEVPEPLRTQLMETTNSQNSGIIVIADRAGKEQLTQVMARRDARVGNSEKSAMDDDIGDSQESRSITSLPWLAWIGFVMVLILSAIFFAAFEIRW
jgi:hypothetical protein